MIISKVKIENFKSIESMEIPFDKNGNSYTKIFVGINESGKSNILEALSYFEVPPKKVSFDHFCNQKLDSKESKITFSLILEESEKKEIKECVQSTIETNPVIDFSLLNIEKVVCLERGSTEFEHSYQYDVRLSNGDLAISELPDGTLSVINKNDASEVDKVLTEENFDNYFYEAISEFLEQNEPYVSVWKPSEKYLLYDADLNQFKENIESNKPLSNIFKLSGYMDSRSIKEAIDKVSDARYKSRLESKLNSAINEYIGKVWKHNIDLLIEIDATGKFSLLIRDKGEENKHDRFAITDRSQGAQHFYQ